jgi:signal transduction histidine kinase
MSSLRVRSILVTAAVVGLALALGGGAIFAWLRAGFANEFRGLVQSHLVAVAAAFEISHGELEWSHVPAGAGGTDARAAVYALDGRRMDGEAWLAPPARAGTLRDPTFIAVTFPDGRPGLAAWASHQPEEDHSASPRQVLVGVALPTALVDRRLADVGWALLIGGAATTAVTLAVLAVALHRLLLPHARLADAITHLDWHHPDRRLPTDSQPAELLPVVTRINELIDRLARASDLARSFNAVAAHELRTPIAGLRATIEVARQGGDRSPALAACHAIVLQMQARIDNLLMAARLEAGQVQPVRDEVDVHALLRTAWEAQTARAAERGVGPHWDLAGSGLAEADGEALRMVVANLFDNAVTYCRPRGKVAISCRIAGGWLVVEVANPGGTLPPDAADRVFDRHWRGSRERGTASRHAGLGLFICRELAGLMGGSLTANLAGDEFRVRLQVPAAGDFEYW